jgi:hypothetical protein
MIRDSRQQEKFRDDLFNEHYSRFHRHRAFCQATLTGLVGERSFLHAHHIFGYADNYWKRWVNNTSNGILLDVEVHRQVHGADYRHRPLIDALRDVIATDYNCLCREYRNYTLPNGGLLIPVWNEYLIMKDLRK